MKQRFQPLATAYQQLNTLLCQTALNIQSTDYTNASAWMQLVTQVQQTFAAFKNFARKEEKILLPVLYNYEPALGAIISDEQHNRMRYLHDVCTLFTAMQSATDKQKSKLFSHKLLYHFNEFVAATVQQLKEQETMINEVLWRYYSDKELTTIAASLTVPAPAPARIIDTSFADAIINNILPEERLEVKHKPARANKINKRGTKATTAVI